MIGARAYLRAAERLPTTDLATLLGPPDTTTLLLAPHPDDESLGCGGLLAAAAAAHRDIRVIVVTDGAASHPNSRAWPKPRLVARRRAETHAALAALGPPPHRVTFLGLPDAALPQHGPALDAAVAAILAGPAKNNRVATILAAWPHDPHRDHAATWVLAKALAAALAWPPIAAVTPAGQTACCRAIRSVPRRPTPAWTADQLGPVAPSGHHAAPPPDPTADCRSPPANHHTSQVAAPTPRLLAYPVWGWVHAHPIAGFPAPRPPRLPGPPTGYRLDIAALLPRKRRAIAAHATQAGKVIRDDPTGFTLPARLLALAHRRFEVFLLDPTP